MILVVGYSDEIWYKMAFFAILWNRVDAVWRIALLHLDYIVHLGLYGFHFNTLQVTRHMMTSSIVGN